MKTTCWAIHYVHGFVKDRIDPDSPVNTILFRTRKHAESWLEDNPYWVKLKAKPVKVKVTITEVW